MSYSKFYPNGWQSGEAGGTPITPDALNHIEDGIASAAERAETHPQHVPAKETANNARFLRNDNTWQTVTPANIGARPSSWTPTKSDVGLGNVANERQYSANNPPPYPVTSVNGKTGAVSLSADNVGAASKTHNHNVADLTWPAMANDTEYKAGFKWSGSDVYCQIIACGAWTKDGEITRSLGCSQIVGWMGRCGSYVLPHINGYSLENGYSCVPRIWRDGSNVKIKMTGGASYPQTTYIMVFYVK